MIFVTKAIISDLPMLTKVDSKIIGNESRKSKIEKYINHEQCYVASHNGTLVGFACYDTTFFECCFIQLVIVDPEFRRLGIAKTLLSYIEEQCPTPSFSPLPMNPIRSCSNYVFLKGLLKAESLRI